MRQPYLLVILARLVKALDNTCFSAEMRLSPVLALNKVRLLLNLVKRQTVWTRAPEITLVSPSRHAKISPSVLEDRSKRALEELVISIFGTSAQMARGRATANQF